MVYEDQSSDAADLRAPPDTLAGSELGGWGAIRRRAVWWDLLLFAVIPVVLVAVYALPEAAKLALAFDYTDPTLVAAYTNHFVHVSWQHLLANLLGYLPVVSTGYLLSLASDRRRQFLVVFTAFLIAFPFALSGLNLLIPRARVAVGFSGINMAFIGYLPVVLLGVTDAFDQQRSACVFFFGLALVGYLAAPGVFGLGLAAASFLAGVLFLLYELEEINRRLRTEIQSLLATEGHAELTLLGGVVFFAYPFVAFPSDVTVNSGIVNLYTHAIGFCLGYIVTYVTVLVGGLEAT